MEDLSKFLSVLGITLGIFPLPTQSKGKLEKRTENRSKAQVDIGISRATNINNNADNNEKRKNVHIYGTDHGKM